MPRWRCLRAPNSRRNGRCRSLRVPPEETARWRQANGLGTGPPWRSARSVRRIKTLDLYPEAARLLAETGF